MEFKIILVISTKDIDLLYIILEIKNTSRRLIIEPKLIAPMDITVA